MSELEVLLVAEPGQVRQVLHQIFCASGYSCQTASDGQEGLAVFKARRPPLVLTELDMPGMTGIEFLGQVRSIDAGVAVIVLASASDVKTRIECLSLGADAYITKPTIDAGEVLAAVERALEARHRTPPRPRAAPRRVSDDAAGMSSITPEKFLDVFQYHVIDHRRRHGRDRSDQFSDGLPIIRAWIDLRSRETVSQADLDGLLDRFAGTSEGMQIYDLWLHILRWGAELGLLVPERHPWGRS